MSILEDKASSISRALQSNSSVPSKVSFDPVIIVTLAGFIAQIVKTILDSCKTPVPAATARVNNPGWVDRWRLRRLARQELAKHPQLAQYADHVVAATLEVGRTVTVTDMATMGAEARGSKVVV